MDKDSPNGVWCAIILCIDALMGYILFLLFLLNIEELGYFMQLVLLSIQSLALLAEKGILQVI